MNVLDLARSKGFAPISNLDPTIQSIVALILGRHGQGRHNQYDEQPEHPAVRVPGEAIGDQYAPTIRLDYNLTDKHRITGTSYCARFVQNVDLLNNQDATFPGMHELRRAEFLPAPPGLSTCDRPRGEPRQRKSRAVAVVAERFLREDHEGKF